MIRSIIVALRGTAASEVALRYAIHVARWHDARVVLLAPGHSDDELLEAREYDTLDDTDEDERFDDEGFEDDEPTPELALRVTDRPLVEAATSLCGQHRVAWLAEGCVGDPTRHLAHYAPRADVITVSRRRTSLARQELPRHAFAALRASARAVLIAPETYHEPQVILAPFDGSAPSARALSLAAETSLRSELPMRVISVGDDGLTTARLDRARRYLAAYSVEAEFVNRTGDPVDQLMALTFELSGTILVMGAYGRSPVQRLLGGSRTERILRGCHGAALAVR